MTERWWLPAFPYPGPNPCLTCGGATITGHRYLLRNLSCDVICPACGGCGTATHIDCEPAQHADWEPDDPDAPAPPGACPACGGRRWNAVQGFDGDNAVYLLRVPCACAQGDLMRSPWTPGGATP